MKRLLMVLLLVGLAFPLKADSGQLYSAILSWKKFVVGRNNGVAGLHRFESDTVWTQLGWENARIFGVSVSESEPDYIFLASGNGALRTLDGGKSWRQTNGWQITEAMDIAINQNTPDEVYLATAYGVWRTENKGDSWQAASTGLSKKYVQTIVTDINSERRVLVGGQGGIYISEDGAKTWQSAGFRNTQVLDLVQCESEPSLWLAGTEDRGVMVSRDGGITWKFVDGKIKQETIYAVAVHPENSNLMAACGYESGLYLSRDCGKNWYKAFKQIPDATIHALLFTPKMADKLWVGTIHEGIYFTDDFGKTWRWGGLNGAEVWDFVYVEGQKNVKK